MHFMYVHCSYYPQTLVNPNLGIRVLLQVPTAAALRQS